MKKKNIYRGIISLILLLGCFLYTYYLDSSNNIENDNISKRVINEDSSSGYLKVYYLDVGQADSILIDCNQKYMLIDAGNNEDGKLLVDYFNSLGIKKFDYVIASHPHEDHIGGMDDIINNFSIDNFYMPDVITTTKTYEDLLDALENVQLSVYTPNAKDTFLLDNSSVQILYVGNDEGNLNDASIVLKLTFGKEKFLFMGDASEKVEKEILNKDLESDVLKVGHHGSQYSTSLKFLEKVSPKYAIISVGKDNSYNHPHDIVLNRLSKIGSRVYRTDIDGTIVITSDGNSLNFSNILTNTDG